MAGTVVFVTSTDYVTVHPSATAPASFSSAVLSSIESVLPISPSHSSFLLPPHSTLHYYPFSSMSSQISLKTSPVTGMPSLPTEFAAPSTAPRTKSNSWNDRFTILIIIGVILLFVLLITFLSYAIYLRCKGDCLKCKRNREKLEKWERGELKVITKEMVKARENLASQNTVPNHADVDIERYDVEGSRPSLWNLVKAMVNTSNSSNREKDPEPDVTLSKDRPISQATVGDRFFRLTPDAPLHTVPEVYSSHPAANPPEPNRTYTQVPIPFAPRSSSIYSRPINSNV